MKLGGGFSILVGVFFGLVFSPVLSDVVISSPAAGSSYAVSGGSASIEVAIIDDGTFPTLTDAAQFIFELCYGAYKENLCQISLMSQTAAQFSAANYKIRLPVQSSIGSNGDYYLRVMIQFTEGSSTHYSSRFRLTGMTGNLQVGTFPDEPDRDPAYDIRFGMLPSSAVNYVSQTGRIFVAPMQLQPGSTVTAKTWTRRFPTSQVSYYTTKGPVPSRVSTITPGWSYTIESGVNAETPALMPKDNGGWYEPARRVSLKPQKVNVHNMRRALLNVPVATNV
ncbi:Knh1p Ecym_2770 [Eremothecium cymbalariae DBVPG|uniref:Yeast cell wall synthesis Kre9/Knh1 C-terminal domain-containing protein n=1 Tax=Eremothecium cymbalariae (strain CBS 270.75 / DBVPG 7215 / KCTC 17166 / NRRL Y-17582) TaxID=931890 RepID=G8JQ06_ERECY|nr:Hypothetical protein Ecym_2770 [Eremothecium cymbalariae DBVPG\